MSCHNTSWTANFGSSSGSNRSEVALFARQPQKLTVDSKKLEHGGEMMYAGVVSCFGLGCGAASPRLLLLLRHHPLLLHPPPRPPPAEGVHDGALLMTSAYTSVSLCLCLRIHACTRMCM